jgi:hypothetical protein
MDIFNLNGINKNILKTNKILIDIYESCEKYATNPTDQSGEEMVTKLIELENGIVTLKKNIVNMVNSISGDEDDSEIFVEEDSSEKGFIIKND